MQCHLSPRSAQDPTSQLTSVQLISSLLIAALVSESAVLRALHKSWAPRQNSHFP
jgi:hypothetical protein